MVGEASCLACVVSIYHKFHLVKKDGDAMTNEITNFAFDGAAEDE